MSTRTAASRRRSGARHPRGWAATAPAPAVASVGAAAAPAPRTRRAAPRSTRSARRRVSLARAVRTQTGGCRQIGGNGNGRRRAERGRASERGGGRERESARRAWTITNSAADLLLRHANVDRATASTPRARRRSAAFAFCKRRDDPERGGVPSGPPRSLSCVQSSVWPTLMSACHPNPSLPSNASPPTERGLHAYTTEISC